MGLFDFLFASNSKATSKTDSKNTQNETQQQHGVQTGTTDQTTNQATSGSSNTNTTQTSSGQSAANISNIVSTLDPATRELLTGLLPGLSANAGGPTNANSDAIRQIAGVLANKGSGGDAAALHDTIAAGQASARLAYETGEGQQVEMAAQGIGSKNNTFSQLVANKGRNDLDTQFNQILANATLESQRNDAANLTGAASILGTASAVGATDANAQLAPLLSAIDVLKGTTTTSNTAQTGTESSATAQQSQTQSLEQILSAILGHSNTTTDTASAGTATATGSQNTVGTQKNSPGLVPSIVSLFA